MPLWHQCVAGNIKTWHCHVYTFVVIQRFPPVHHHLSLLPAIAMTESSSNVASHILPGHQTHTLAGHQRCQISQKYAVSFEDISAAFFYASCRLLAIHRVIKIDPTFHSQNPADFYKNMSWEVDVSCSTHPSMSSIDRPPRHFSLHGSPFVFRQITPGTITKSSKSSWLR